MTDPSIQFAQANFVWSTDAWDSDFSVEFPKAPNLDLFLIGAELYQEAGMHDRLVLHFKGKPYQQNVQFVSKDPVKFTYRSGKNTSVFYGNIWYVEQVNTLQGGNTDVVCLSASYVLKNSDQRIFKNMSADKVVAKIANENSMSAVTQTHPLVRASIVQPGQSNWQFLQSLAKQTGFALIAENTNLTFVSKDKIFNSKKGSAPYYFYIDNQYAGAEVRQTRAYGTIISFNPIISDESPERGIAMDRVFNGVNPDSTTAINVTHAHTSLGANSNSGAVIPSPDYFL